MNRHEAQVAAGLSLIKGRLPLTYAAIQSRAQQHGQGAFALVRRSLRGEPNCFYALEAGHVVGTPFNQVLTPDVAALMVQFETGFVVMWPLEQHMDSQ